MVPRGQAQVAHSGFGWVRREPNREPGKRIVPGIDLDTQDGTRVRPIPELTWGRVQLGEQSADDAEGQTARGELILRERLLNLMKGIRDDRIVQDVSHDEGLESVLVNGCARVAREKRISDLVLRPVNLTQSGYGN